MSFSEWKLESLGDLVDIKHGYAYKGEDFSKEKTKFILLTPGNFKIGGGFKSDKFKYYKEDAELPEDYILQTNDLLVTMTDLSVNSDTLGYPLLIPETGNTSILHNQRTGKIIINSNNIHREYLYYALCTTEYRHHVTSTATGTTVKHTSPKRLESYKFKLPPLQEQKAIAHVLSTLDEKIEVNNKINKTLEEMAQAIFKHWFVDFEFPNEDGEPYKSSGGEMVDSELGPIPKGWKVGKLGDLVEIKYGKDHKKLNTGKIPVYGSGGLMRFAERSLYDKVSVLIPRKGTLNNVMLVNHPFWTVDTMFYTEMKYAELDKYIFCFMKTIDLLSMNSGSAVPSMTTAILNQIPVIVKPMDVINRFNLALNPIYNMIYNNNSANTILTSIRDTLLPKLMSGEIRVPIDN